MSSVGFGRFNARRSWGDRRPPYWKALILVLLFGAAILVAPAEDARSDQTNYAAETQAAIVQLIGAADLFRDGRVGDAQAKLRSMRASLDRLAGVADQFRELANREHARCMERITDLEVRTSDLFQQQEQIFEQIADLDTQIAAAAGSAQIANAQIAELSNKI